MKTEHENSRRKFLASSVKSAVVLGVGATFVSALLDPLASVAQNSTAAIQAKIAMLGTTSLQTSKLALTKATNPQVKMFAKYEAAEQETMGHILRDMGTKVPAPSPEGTTMLNKLQGLSGAAFDKAFMQGQVDTHQKLHAAVSSLRNASRSAHVKHVAALALATITEHTERGQMLLAQLG